MPEITFTAPEGPIARKYLYALYNGLAPGAIPGAPYVDPDRIIYLRGDIRTSKTTCAIDKIIATHLFCEAPTTAILRGKLQDLKRTTLATFERRIREVVSPFPHDLYRINERDWKIEWKDGGTTWLFGLDYGDPTPKLQSLELVTTFIDECNEVEAKVIELALMRTVSAKAYYADLKDAEDNPLEMYNQLVLVSNRNRGRDWYWKKFMTGTPTEIQEVEPGFHRKYFGTEVVNGKEYTLTSMTIESYFHENHSKNEALNEGVIFLGQESRTRWVGGTDDVDTGLLFPEYNDRLHAISRFAIPQDWDIYAGVDHGIDHPTVFLFIAHDKWTNTFYVIDEYISDRSSVAENAFAVKEKIGMLGRRIKDFWCDPSMEAKNPNGQSVIEMYREEGLNLKPSSRTQSELGNDLGLQRIRDWMKVKGTALGNKAHFYVFSNCYQTNEQLSTITIEQFKKRERYKDDVAKALRYFASALPMPRQYEQGQTTAVHTQVIRS